MSDRLPASHPSPAPPVRNLPHSNGRLPQEALAPPGSHPAGAEPPANPIGWLRWLRENLFSSTLNTAVTLAILSLLLQTIPALVDWLFLEADWWGDDRNACDGAGACWVFVGHHLPQFIYGLYPGPERWRVDLAAVLFAAPLLGLAWPRLPGKRLLAFFVLIPYPALAFWLLHGGFLGLEKVETSLWGGLMLTVIIAAIGISAALPLGILLALGRRSRLPVIRALCVAFIELWRGAPLITVLFMSSVMLPLFLPEGVNFDKLLRALIGIALFQSAYMAEVVRGGLQAIPRGQFEAAAALGLNHRQTLARIILPQALTVVIPGIVNTFIALFKDTSLVVVIGLFDLLGIVQAALTDPEWLGFATEGYLFAALLFWIFCFGLSRYSQALEARLDTGNLDTENRG